MNAPPSQADILIVEDSATQAEKLRYLIGRKGYRARVAGNGRLALAAIRAQRPDLVLSDIVMPELDGYGLCRALKADPQLADIPVILITALTELSDIVGGLECGADNFIRKPFSDAYLLGRIEQVLLNQQLRHSARDAGESGIVVAVDNQRYVIASKPQQILDLLISIYEQAVVGNEELQARERQVKELNARLVQHASKLETANREMHEMLQKLSMTQETLLRSEKLAALGALVAGVAHELNTPIGNSLLVATTLADHTQHLSERMAQASGLKRSELEAYIHDACAAGEFLYRNLNRAAELISTFKQVSVDQTSSRRRPFDLRQTVEEIVTTLTPMLKKTPFIIEQQVPPQILLDSYPGPLGQVIVNLVTNAVVHGFDGRAEGSIVIGARRRDAEMVELSVSDNGIGIPPDNLKRIYDPFFTTKLGAGGSGLGLNITYNIVTRVLGGSIDTQSTVGAGTTVTLVIPCHAPECDPKEPPL